MAGKTALVAGATGATAKRLVEALLQDVASWPFADFLWGLDKDLPTDTTRIRRHGFHGVIDTQERILEHLQRCREAKILP